jgi:hypothetical protein
MVQGVFKDITYFVAFFAFIILTLGVLFKILLESSGEAYKGIEDTGYFLMAFRTSLGDFDVDSYKDQSSLLVVVTWILWFLAVVISNLIFMNFIIAVISESYSNVMQNVVQESYRVKAQMIAERELHFVESDLANEVYFPKYLIVRRPANFEGQVKPSEVKLVARDLRNFLEKQSLTEEKGL